MASQPQPGSPRGAGITGRGAFFCLLALLSYLFLPLVYYAHLGNSSVSSFLRALEAGPAITCPSQIPVHPSPNNGTCPICLAADSSQDCGYTLALHLPPILSWAQPYFFFELPPIDNLCFSVPAARAPPYTS